MRPALPLLGLLLLPCLPLASAEAQPSTEAVEFSDNPNDLKTFNQPVYAGDSQVADLLGVRLSRTEYEFEVELRVAEVRSGAGQPTDPEGYVVFDMTFRLATAPLLYGIQFLCHVGTGATPAEDVVKVCQPAEFHLTTDRDVGAWFAPVEVDDARNAFRVRFPLDYLFRSSRGAELPEIIDGDRLTGFTVWATKYTFILPLGVSRTDEAVAPAGQELDVPAIPNRRVRVGLGERDRPLFIVPGANTTLAFTVHNAAPTKQILLLEYQAVSPGSASPLQLFGPRSVAIPANQARNYTFWVHAPTEFPPARVQVLARSLGNVSYGFDHRPVARGVDLGSAPSQLHFRNLQRPQHELVTGCTVPCRNDVKLMHDVSQRPADEARPAAYPWMARGPQAAPFGVARPFSLEPGERVEADIALRSERARSQIQVRFSLAYSVPGQADHTLVNGEGLYDVGTTASAVRFETSVKPRPAVLPAHGTLRWFLEVGDSTIAESYAAPIEFVVAESIIRLPLREVPPEFQPLPPPQRFQLQALEEPSDYVNPGKVHVFRLGLLNIDSLEQRVHLRVQAPPGWDATLEPGEAFDLGPGDNVVLGLVVRAPANAADGTVASFAVNASDDQGIASGVRLGLTVLTQVDVEDQATRFQVDADDAAKVASDAPKDTPALPAIVCALMGLGLALRRRVRGKRPL